MPSLSLRRRMAAAPLVTLSMAALVGCTTPDLDAAAAIARADQAMGGAQLKSIRDLDRLGRLADAVLTAQSWPELLATP